MKRCKTNFSQSRSESTFLVSAQLRKELFAHLDFSLLGSLDFKEDSVREKIVLLILDALLYIVKCFNQNWRWRSLAERNAQSLLFRTDRLVRPVDGRAQRTRRTQPWRGSFGFVPKWALLSYFWDAPDAGAKKHCLQYAIQAWLEGARSLCFFPP